MKFSAIFVTIAALPTMIAAVTTSYDTAYDNAGQSLNTVACSNGPNGLITRGFTTFGSLPNFPNIGGVPAITGWNDPDCGSCWNLTYTNSQGVARSVSILGIDVATPDYNIALGAMNTLTNNQAVQLGRVTVTAARVPPSVCGL